MARDKVTKVYQFDELSDRAKERAREWYREGNSDDTFWSESVIEDAARLGDIIGINLRAKPVKLMGGGTRMEPDVYWSVGSLDEGASFSGSYSYRKGAICKLEQEAPSKHDGKVQEGNHEVNLIAKTLAEVQKRNWYQLQASIGHGRHWQMDIDVERADGKEVSSEDCETVQECLHDFAHWIKNQLEREWEYQNSDEQVDESIRANEYEFDEEGNIA